MNILDLLPTKKVSAFLLGAALTLIAFWILDDVFGIVSKPEALVLGAFVIVIGFILAWIVPEGAWKKAEAHVDGDG